MKLRIAARGAVGHVFLHKNSFHVLFCCFHYNHERLCSQRKLSAYFCAEKRENPLGAAAPKGVKFNHGRWKAPGEVDLLGGVAFIVSFCRSLWYTGDAARPAQSTKDGRRGVSPYGVYFFFCSVRRSECSVLLHLQVA